MEKVECIIPRLVIGLRCLWLLVMKMGTMMKPAIFEERISKRLAKWDQAVKRQKASREASSGSSQVDLNQASVAVQLAEVRIRNNEFAGEIAPELPLRDEYESFHFKLPSETSPSCSNP
ncbi:MLO-like protein 1 [Prunus yedoensis var. nudiflora]|uniref:MLO-like protein 1 n=1 Tax=Prunus yedoensis var. nudiflora TaxID=2094558 RepID=A0A314ZIY7_PRUYE|nr:MLO-like protein 1 [Prunus yedoensis var. nudiflora]